MILFRPGVKLVPRLLVAMLLVLALASVLQGFFNAVRFSSDLQWSPVRLLVEGINPYQEYLRGNPDGRLVSYQFPNYAQLLYVLMAPLGGVSLEVARPLWALFSIAMGLVSCWGVARVADLRGWRGVALTALFFCSTPVRNSLGNGQTSLLVLAAFVGAVLLGERAGVQRMCGRRCWVSALVAGISYVKYSFLPTLSVAYFIRWGKKYALITLLPLLAGFVAFAGLIGGVTPASLLEPFRVAAVAVDNGQADLLAVLRMLPPFEPHRWAISLLCVLLAGAAPFWVPRRALPLTYWGFVSVASLTFITHLLYDYVFYLLPAAWGIKNLERRAGLVILVLIGYHWFAIRMVVWLKIAGLGSAVVGLATNLAILAILRAGALRESALQSEQLPV